MFKNFLNSIFYIEINYAQLTFFTKNNSNVLCLIPRKPQNFVGFHGFANTSRRRSRYSRGKRQNKADKSVVNIHDL